MLDQDTATATDAFIEDSFGVGATACYIEIADAGVSALRRVAWSGMWGDDLVVAEGNTDQLLGDVADVYDGVMEMNAKRFAEEMGMALPAGTTVQYYRGDDDDLGDFLESATLPNGRVLRADEIELDVAHPPMMGNQNMSSFAPAYNIAWATARRAREADQKPLSQQILEAEQAVQNEAEFSPSL